jgi:hypothetical protein
MKRWAAVAIGALLILWVPFLYWQLRGQPRPEPPAEAPAPELNEPPVDPSLTAPPQGQTPAPAPTAPAPAAPVAKPAEPAPAANPPPGPVVAPAPTMNPDGTPNLQNQPAPSGGLFTELKAKYENSARDAEAPEAEALIRDQFGKNEVPAEMLRTVSCHAKACKVELLWSPDRVLAFMRISMTWARVYSIDMGVTPGEKNADGFTPLELYLSRGGDGSAKLEQPSNPAQ